MNCRKPLLCLAIGIVLSGTTACGGGKPGGSAPAAPTDVATLLARADTNKGKILFLQCRACHSLVEQNEPGKIGPTLYGVIGRSAGTAPGFAFSDAVARSGIVWTPENIAKWLQRPSDLLPGNKMIFVGMPEAQDRADVIAYIRQQTTPASR